MKNIIVAAIALAVAGIGYVVYQNQTQPDIKQEAQAPAAPAEPVDIVEEAITPEPATTVEEAAQNLQETAQQAVDDVVTDTKQAAQDALTSVVEGTADVGTALETVTQAAETSAQDAVQGVVETVTDTAQKAVENMENTVQSATTDTATDTATDTTQAAVTEPADPLSVAGFDLAQVTGMIDGSSMNDMTKLALKAGLQQAQNNPDQLKQILDQIKAALQK